MKRTTVLIMMFITAVMLPVTLFAQKKESLALFPFTGGNVSDGTAIVSSLARQRTLRDAFNKVTLVTQNTITTMNFEQRFQRNSGLTDADTIFELGKALNASHVIAGYITKLGDRNLVIVSIMDVESLQQIAGDYRAYSTIEEIDALIADIAKKLAGAVPRNTSALPGLSVPPFNISSGVNQNDAMVLAQILSCDLANSGKYAVLPRTDSIEKVMEEQKRQRSGVTDQERIKRLGAGRNAQYVLSGSVQRLGNLNKFAVDILDILDGSFMDGYEEQYTSLSQGFELIPKLAMQASGGGSIPTRTPAANTQSANAPSTAQSADSIRLVSTEWQPNKDPASTVNINVGREYIDGQERDVLTLEVNVARGDAKWAGVARGDEIAIQQLKVASGVRLKALGDGKIWTLTVAMSETWQDGNIHYANISTRKGRVVEIDIPFSQLKQPSWGKKVTFNKNSITGLGIQRTTAQGAGATTIKVFDIEIY